MLVNTTERPFTTCAQWFFAPRASRVTSNQSEETERPEKETKLSLMVKRANTVGSPDVDANGHKRLRDSKVATVPASSLRNAPRGQIIGSGAITRESAPNETCAAFPLRLRRDYLSAEFAIHGSSLFFGHPWPALHYGPTSAVQAAEGPPLRLLLRPLTRPAAGRHPWRPAAGGIHAASVAAIPRPSMAAWLRKLTNLGVAGRRERRATRQKPNPTRPTCRRR